MLGVNRQYLSSSLAQQRNHDKSMVSINQDFTPFATRMNVEGLPDIVVETFKFYYTQLVDGHTGLIPDSDITPVEHLPDLEKFPKELAKIGQRFLPKTIVLKLNGGLGTSMGMNRAKSLLTVKDEWSFLDIIARQTQLRGMRLVLMNSFSTRSDCLTALKDYLELWDDIPLDFVQHKVPKINQADLSPADWPENRDLEWCPPGHGDIYTSLVTSGMLDRLLKAGYEYVFISNSDNLGAVMDTTILGFFVENQLSFLMEATDRTPAHRKGGHLARLSSGQLILREVAQCPSDDINSFQDINRHKYFNTNNLWLHLPTLKAVMRSKGNILGLPMIRNSKTIDPRRPTSYQVYQLETAMGSAIAVFETATAIRVPQSRFVQVKRTEDLLVVRSDICMLSSDFQVVPNPNRNLGPILVTLDESYYQLIDDMEARFPEGVPSLIDCEQLKIVGDIKFGANVTLCGVVELINLSGKQIEINDGTTIEGSRTWSN